MSLYDFVDTTEAPWAQGTPAEAVCFNGIWLDNEIEGFRTLNVSGREVSDKDIDTKDTKAAFGETFQRASYPPRTITVTYQLMAESDALFRQYYNKLNELLSPEQAKLVFADEPDKYFIATKSGNDEVDAGMNSVTGYIKFYCADPLKYSTTLKEFTAAADDDGILKATIVNNGTVDVPIEYEITHASDNGFIGIVSEYGAIQYGLPDEEDGYTYTKSERLVTMDTVYNTTDDAEGTACAMMGDFTVNATMSKTYMDGGYWLNPSLKKTGQFWNGAQRTITIPADAEGNTGSVNFYLYMKEWFRGWSLNELGCQCIAVLDADDNIICGIQMVKSTLGTSKTYYTMWANGKVIQTKTFLSDNSSGNCFNQTNGNNCIRKEGDRLTFYFCGYHSLSVPELKTVEAAKIQISIGGLGAYNCMTRNCIGAFTFDKLHVDAFQDEPNRYGNGDVVRVDGNTNKVYVNGLVRMNDEIRGADYFHAQSGETDVEFVFSDWIQTTPTVRAYIREAWL